MYITICSCNVHMASSSKSAFSNSVELPRGTAVESTALVDVMTGALPGSAFANCNARVAFHLDVTEQEEKKAVQMEKYKLDPGIVSSPLVVLAHDVPTIVAAIPPSCVNVPKLQMKIMACIQAEEEMRKSSKDFSSLPDIPQQFDEPILTRKKEMTRKD
uniref:Uncharacterized protein n=1 Tax=Attheya septentrionalis TaxID=420275 RepID=A0A7S2XK51_9STRA|mmetsp:Transcript_15744/g.28630  ORF Transcript_15744/g.28630 Transcript_15744/m.28630 type:complete len:159 (+) Transcript_15744:42-518(+)